MGEGEEVKIRDESNVEIQERGEIFMFYRPKVNKEEAHSEDDVQRLYLVLRPESSAEGRIEQKQSSSTESGDNVRSGGHGVEEVNLQKETLMRLIVMGQKSLPNIGNSGKKGRPHWGFVELVTTNTEDIKSALQQEEYETKTRGRRHKAAARALGEGVYRILNHTYHENNKTSKSMHTHLVYKLQFPNPNDENSNSPQRQLHVKPEASFLLQIKNPESKNPESTNAQFQGVQRKRRATFPASLQGLFGKRRYVAANPPDFLNYEGCELLLISASDDVEEELGLELKTDIELQEEEGRSSSCGEEEDEDKVYKCSNFVHTFGEDSGISTTPLFQGSWA